MKLEEEDFELLYKALLDAFTEEADLEVLSKFALNLALNAIGPPAPHRTLVLRIITRAESLDRIERLIAKARELNVHNESLEKFDERFRGKLELELVRNSSASNSSETKNVAIRERGPESEPRQPPSGQVIVVTDENDDSKLEEVATRGDAFEFESRLTSALDSFDWTQAEVICDQIIFHLRTEPERLPEQTAKWLLNLLRRKGLFVLMSRLAETLLSTGMRSPQIRRQYAQALIDQGALSASEAVLQSLIGDKGTPFSETIEARGLLGRIYKQRYLEYPHSADKPANLARAINEYGAAYTIDPQNHLWHGINLVALVARARRDKVQLHPLPDEISLAGDILTTIEERQRESTEPLFAWDIATLIEANVALSRHREATEMAFRYVESYGTDVFEVSSTLKQLTTVWQLTDQEPPGSQVLPILHSALLSRQGAKVAFDTGGIERGISTINSESAATKGLSATFGEDRLTTLTWYKKALEQCNSIARVEKRNGKGHGTGWLVNAADFFSDQQGVLLLTVNHVVSPDPNPLAIFPDECQINFQAEKEIFEVEKVVWYSAYTDLDATFLKLKGEPKAPPLTLHKKRIEMSEPPPRLYIIGHPWGRDLELSMQDNQLLASNESLLHYRTPTAPGSAGSPVFESEDWRVVALHHKGSYEMSRIDGLPGTYQANEGISILAIQRATRGF